MAAIMRHTGPGLLTFRPAIREGGTFPLAGCSCKTCFNGWRQPSLGRSSMKLSKQLVLCGVVAAGLVAAPLAAIASHGKVGLWSITTTMDMGGMRPMPQMPQMTPEQMAKMKQMGIQMPGMGGPPHTMTTQHCMTAAEVNSDKPPPAREHDCTMTNEKIAGQSMSADMVCTGEMKGNGHLTVIYDSTEHYSGKMDFTGASHGHQMSMTNTFEGKWVSANCGTVAH